MKEGVIRRLIAESRRTSLRSSIDGHKTRLIHELSELRSSKKELEDLLESARIAERNHSDELRKQEEGFQAEMARMRRDSQCEIRQLVRPCSSLLPLPPSSLSSVISFFYQGESRKLVETYSFLLPIPPPYSSSVIPFFISVKSGSW